MLEHVLSIAAAQVGFSSRDPASRQNGFMLGLLSAPPALLPLLALGGWLLGSIELVAVLPGLPTMKANTAVAFLALTVGVAAPLLAPRTSVLRVIGLGLAATIATLSMLQSALGIDLSVDQWLLPDRFGQSGQPAGRPAPAAAAAVLALSIGAWLPRHSRWRPIPLLLAFMIGYLSTVGLLLETRWTGTLGQAFVSVSISSSICTLLLAAVLLGNTVWRGSALESLASGAAGAQLLRTWLPIALLAPAAVMWLEHLASSNHWWDVHGGLAVAVTVTACVFMAVAVRSARWIDALQADLRAANEQLRERVAQRTEALAELQSAHDITAAALRSRTDFLSHVSHELRTPLNAILGFSQLMLMDRDRSLDEHQRGQLAHVMTAARQLTMLVDDLLDFASADAGRMTMSAQAADATELARLATQQIGPEAMAAGIEVRLDVLPGSDGYRVHVDRGRLLQMLGNLLSNAVKYNRRDGAVRVQLRRDGAEVVIAVTDSGQGIDPAQFDQLFVPFSRLGREGGTVPGTGIGLALSQRLVVLMGGRIDVSSQPGVGSVFTVRLPAAPPG